jgi:hypothetical protein
MEGSGPGILPNGIVAVDEVLQSESACSVYMILAVGIGSSYKRNRRWQKKNTTM